MTRRRDGEDPILELILARRSLLKGGMVGGAALMLAACGGGNSGAGSGASGSTSAGTTVPDTKPEKLIVRSWGDPWSTNIGDYPGETFSEETGIPVEFDLTDHGEIQTKVQQSIDAGQRPPVDVVYTIGTYAFSAGVQGLAVPLDPKIVTNFDKLTAAGKPRGDVPFYVNLYTYTYPVIFVKNRVGFPSDMSWNELWDPKYQHSMHADQVFTSLLYPVAKIQGLDVATADLTPVWDRIAELRPNVASIGDDTVFIEAMKSGEVNFGLALVGDALALQDAGVDVGWVVPSEGISLTADSMYVCQGLPNDVTYWAQVFVNEVIDAKLQSEWCAKVATVPTNSEATPADFMAGDPAFPFSDEELTSYAIIEPIDVAAQNNDEWQSAYRAALEA